MWTKVYYSDSEKLTYCEVREMKVVEKEISESATSLKQQDLKLQLLWFLRQAAFHVAQTG